MTRPLRILISAGEASGDRLGAGLARALRRRRPDIDLFGMGGEEMDVAGVRLVQPASEVAVVGILEVLKQLPALRRAMRSLEDLLVQDKPDLFVPVDFPDFNLRLAERARRAGIPVVYFVSPQVWAWRKGRVRKIRALVRRMLVLFPFEPRFYEEAGVPVTFVGHPALDEVASPESRDATLGRLRLDPSRPRVALLPGSRRGEVARLLPILLAAARILVRSRPGLQFLIPRARTLPEGLLDAEVERARIPGVHVRSGDYREILRACEAGVVASGTATLDAALAGLPMVVVYRMQAASYWVARSLVRVDNISLPNLVLGRRLVPELVQRECTPERIAHALETILSSPAFAEEIRLGLAEVRARLGGAGAFDRAALAILAEAESRDS